MIAIDSVFDGASEKLDERPRDDSGVAEDSEAGGRAKSIAGDMAVF